MAEIVFPCTCGMILKVYDDDQIGRGIQCPSCSSTVIVPDSSEDVEAWDPSAPGGPAAPQAASKFGKWLGLAYLAGVGAVSLGLIKFVLMPVLAPPAVVAHVAPAREEKPESTAEDPEDGAPRRLLKKPRGRTARESADPGGEPPRVAGKPKSPLALAERRSMPRTGPDRSPGAAFPVPTASDEETDKPDDSETPPPTGPGGLGGTGGGFGGMPAAPRGGMWRGFGGLPAGSPARPRRSRADAKPKTDEPKAAKKSQYQHITNNEARKALEVAAVNAGDFASTWIAENSLKVAERAANGDPEVLAEIKKLRDKIEQVRNHYYSNK